MSDDGTVCIIFFLPTAPSVTVKNAYWKGKARILAYPTELTFRSTGKPNLGGKIHAMKSEDTMDLERVFFFLKAPVLFFWSVGLGAEPEDRINGGSLITGAVVAILGAVLCLATNPLQPWSFVIAYITGFLAFDEERPWWMYCYYALFASGYVIVSIVTALWRLSGG